MLSDRPYMRADYPREGTSTLTWLLCALFAASVVQFVFEGWMNNHSFTALFALNTPGLLHGKVWTLLTYSLLHDGVLHLLLNMLGLFLIGREVAPLLGSQRFAILYTAAAALAGLAWLGAQTLTPGGNLVGASGCVMALFIFFACVYPEREVNFLLFFVLPVTVRPRVLAYILVGVESLGLLFSELPGRGFSGVAHSAHLGGMLAGWLYHRFFYANAGLDRATAPMAGLRWPQWLRSRPSKSAPTTTSNTEPRNDADLRIRVDRILDKINASGFGSLTAEEKRLLDEARDLLNRR